MIIYIRIGKSMHYISGGVFMILNKRRSTQETASGKHILQKTVVVLLLCAVIFGLLKLTDFHPFRFWKGFGNGEGSHEGEVTTISQSSLEKVFELSELATLEYTYNAVARAYDTEDKTKIRYYVAYEGTVTVGIDFSKIIVDSDDGKKVISIEIPPCQIQDTTVDFGSMEYIFVDSSSQSETVSQEAYGICEDDLKKRAANEEQLMELAEENTRTTVEALVKPWVDQIDDTYKVMIDGKEVK